MRPGPQPQQFKRKSLGTLSTVSSPAVGKSISGSFDSLSDRDTTSYSVRDSTQAPSMATGTTERGGAGGTVPAATPTTSSTSCSSEEGEEEEEGEESESESESLGEGSLGKSLERSEWTSESHAAASSSSSSSSSRGGGRGGGRGSMVGGEEDSDAWHSESEANWTLVMDRDASTRNGRDILQSQVLSEEGEGSASIGDSRGENFSCHQRRPSVTFEAPPPPSVTMPRGGGVGERREALPPFSEHEEEEGEGEGEGAEPRRKGILPQLSIPPPTTPPPTSTRGKGHVTTPTSHVTVPPPGVDSKGVVGGVLGSPPPDAPVSGFLPPRPAEVFGVCSWNALPLATTSTLMQAMPDASGENA